MSSTGVPLDTERATGGEHSPSASAQDACKRPHPDQSVTEYQQLIQTPVLELTVSDVNRLTELRAQAIADGDDSRVETIDDRLVEFTEEANLPAEVVVQSEFEDFENFENFEASAPSRGERAIRTVAGLSCGVGLGFVLGGPEGVLAGAVIGYVLITQFPTQEVSQRDEQ